MVLISPNKKNGKQKQQLTSRTQDINNRYTNRLKTIAIRCFIIYEVGLSKIFKVKNIEKRAPKN